MSNELGYKIENVCNEINLLIPNIHDIDEYSTKALECIICSINFCMTKTAIILQKPKVCYLSRAFPLLGI